MGTKTITRCQLCYSPFRKEILSAYEKKVDMVKIYKKYRQYFIMTKSNSFSTMIKNHIKRGHVCDAIIVPPALDSEIRKDPATMERFVQRLLELGMIKLDKIAPEDIAVKDVISGQKLLIESKKLRLDEGGMMLSLSKLFGPPVLTVEGEEVRDVRPALVESGKDSGDK